ncbi:MULTISPECIES: desulfoferrodoxin [Methanocorpusculum]|jgi:superoxide reductase|uniref:DNA topoisomerase II n=1 Tax=Methanocorpusculum parvum TaxID=2193 RepID=A0AAX0Q6T1_9EURY|nr:MULTISPECIES: desulfoferrodoxin [Methanocorpusculum]MDD2249217.1 desulfoferrodoxin [Methanocorpusculum sp.]MDD3047557.1 desulfoferrodoxin [Methanocorpusculum sp.]MDD4424224.1 desulfoferrodoxin [Methanocorpusculum parvum]MDY3203077.1 desulfoferrodoxin [Methanocorpusculum sp.]MEA5087087.1 desulfoferrodoxin [Methanocorpusculum sp.]
MAQAKEIYKCNICGNTVRVINGGRGELVCCGEPMELLAENSTDAAVEKHVPVVEEVAGGYKVVVGSAPHPMIDEHFITWIALKTDDDIVHEKFLSAGEKPEMVVKTSAKAVKAGEYCNIHGLWVKKV